MEYPIGTSFRNGSETYVIKEIYSLYNSAGVLCDRKYEASDRWGYDIKTFTEMDIIMGVSHPLVDPLKIDPDKLARYENYFDECERANKIPLKFAQWVKIHE